jgi:hypothetical protein
MWSPPSPSTWTSSTYSWPRCRSPSSEPSPVSPQPPPDYASPARYMVDHVT